MEVAGPRDDALITRMAARVPTRMPTFSLALARILATGMLDVIAMGDGKGKFVRLLTPRSGLGPANLIGVGEGDAQTLAIFGEEMEPVAAIL